MEENIDITYIALHWTILTCKYYLLRQAAQLQFRGQRIWLAAMEELMSIGMRFANQVVHTLMHTYNAT